MLTSHVEHGPSFLMIEGGVTVIAIAAAFCWPRLGSEFFSTIERAFSSLARRKRLSVLVVGLTALLLRLATIPLNPIPHPFGPDDFSFLLAANTFASGRLTNPTPAMWTHFETFHVTMVPTYMSMYFPAQGLVMAAGKVLVGHPWYGILAMTALMCAALCWMLQAWLPPTWALLGGFIVLLRFGLFSYWINTYTGAGSITALGGALVLGSLPRLMRDLKFRHGLLMAIGIILLATSRPYEGLLLCLPIAFVLGRWAFFGENKPNKMLLFRRAAVPLLLIFAAGAWMGYYDYRAFGNPLTPPYKVDRTTYAVAPYFIWQPTRPAPVYRHRIMREFYTGNELVNVKEVRSVAGFLTYSSFKILLALVIFAGVALFPPLIMLRRVLMDRRTRFFVYCMLFFMAGMAIEIFLIPHYLAPFTAVFYVLGLQAMRHLRIWRPERQPVGRTLVRLIVTICIAMTGLRLYAEPLHLLPPEWPPSNWNNIWYGPAPFGTERAHIKSHLESLPGKQLVIVQYSQNHNPLDEWVYNAPDIAHAKVIWARDMGPAENLDLIRYYKGRTVWLVQPDKYPAALAPYPVQEQEAARLK